MSTLLSTSPTHSLSSWLADRATLDLLLAPLHETAHESPSLLASRHAVQSQGSMLEIPKFLLLGQRGGGQPIRLALFAGLDAGSMVSTAALVRLLLQYELSPILARDFALFAYPVVNLAGFGEKPAPLEEFERRFDSNRPDEDVRFFGEELRQWTFDGLVSLRSDAGADGFYAKVRSQVIGREVALPALQGLGRTLPLALDPVLLQPEGRLAGPAGHALITTSRSAPHPFEIEVFAPGRVPIEQGIVGLFLFVQEVLRNYRRVISHAANL